TQESLHSCCVFYSSIVPPLILVGHNSRFHHFFFSSSRAHRDLHSFPTRRSSDLNLLTIDAQGAELLVLHGAISTLRALDAIVTEDRKSTRLNSSHVAISYAVFCLTKKILKITTNLVLARKSIYRSLASIQSRHDF